MQAAGTSTHDTTRNGAQNGAPTRGTVTISREWWLYTAIVLAALAIRAPTFGDLNYHIDEGFYLLVGDRMRDGLLPYVDIWDRKPFGLFLLYWAIAAVGDGSMLAVQLAAGLCAAATAVVLATIARRWVGPLPALLATIAYLAGLEALAGGGGQSPIFYNLPVAAMALLTLRAGDAHGLPRFRHLAIAAVLCGGVALTIKQTALAECLFFGGMLVRHASKLNADKAVVLREAALLAVLGALPSLACLGFYAAIGHGGDYLFATLFSSFGRTPMAWGERGALAAYLVPRIVPLLAMAVTGLALLARRPAPEGRTDGAAGKGRGSGTGGGAGILAGWIGAAGAGFLIVPNFYDHYALPLLPSLCVGAALLFARRPLGPVFGVLAIAIALAFAGWPAFERTRATNAAMRAAARTIVAHGGGEGGSLYVFDGPVQLYTLARAPLPTRWVFPEHLSTAEEHNATGADTTRELAAILRDQPAVIVAANQPGARHADPIAWRMLGATVARDYAHLRRIEIPEFAGTRTISLFVRRPRQSYLAVPSHMRPSMLRAAGR
jgi:hypothetical protein